MESHEQIPEHRAATSRFSPRAPLFTGGIIVFLFTLLFTLPWWNRYLGLTNQGWYQFFGMQILKGHIPYRGFYLFVPPGQAFTMAALTSLFGQRVVAPEVFGFAGAIVLATALYVWLARLFGPYWATVAVVCTTAVYLRGPTESLSGLHLNANLYPTLALLAASFALDRTASSGKFVILTGFLAGASFITKQTAGIAVTVALGFVLPTVVATRSGGRASVRTAGLLALGWSIPVFVTSLWLGLHGALHSFIAAVYLNGPSSKGSVTSLLLRQIKGVLSSRYLQASVALAFLLVLVVGLLLHFKRGAVEGGKGLSKEREVLALCAFGAVAIGLTIWAEQWPNALPSTLHRVDMFSLDLLIYLGELGCFALLGVYGWLFYRRKLTDREEQLLLAAVTGSACSVLLSFSWANSRTMLVPACPFVLAFGLSTIPAGRVRSLVRPFALITVFVFVAVAAGSKMRYPYFWADWKEGDALRATVALDFPELRGIRVTPETATFMRRIVGDIQQYSHPEDPIAEFPTMPILYILAHRAPSTFAYVHYIDVTPDDIYIQDAQKIERDPPALIVLLDRSDGEIKEGEINFRNSHRSGERALWETLQKMSSKYQVVDTFPTPNTNQLCEVWLRR